MSLRASRHAWASGDEIGGCFLVKLAIADSFREDMGYCCPSQFELARKCRMSDRNLRNHLRDLIAAGEIAVVPGEGRQRSRYVYLYKTATLPGFAVVEIEDEGGSVLPPSTVCETGSEVPPSQEVEIHPARKEASTPSERRVSVTMKRQGSSSLSKDSPEQTRMTLLATEEGGAEEALGADRKRPDWAALDEKLEEQHAQRVHAQIAAAKKRLAGG